MSEQKNTKANGFQVDIKKRIKEHLNILVKADARYQVGILLCELPPERSEPYRQLVTVIIDALFESMVNALWCFYDKRGQTSVYRTLGKLEHYPTEFKESSDRCNSLLKSLEREIETLRTRRNKITAHRDKLVLHDERIVLPFGEFDNLLQTAKKILHIISSAFSVCYYGYDIASKQYVLRPSLNAVQEFNSLGTCLRQLDILNKNLKESDKELLITSFNEAYFTDTVD